MTISVDLWSDGACSGNPGPGGYAALLVVAGHPPHEVTGGEKHTTNNRMELMGVIAGLRALKKPCEVTVHTDSSYVLGGFDKGWYWGWKTRSFRTSSGSPVANRELWEMLELEIARHDRVTWVKVKGHAGVEYNERCDRLAVAAAARQAGRPIT